jgi:hypothetical protein
MLTTGRGSYARSSSARRLSLPRGQMKYVLVVLLALVGAMSFVSQAQATVTFTDIPFVAAHPTGSATTASVPFTSNTASSWNLTGTVYWGDGYSSSASLQAGFAGYYTASAEHYYTTAGSYSLYFRVTDWGDSTDAQSSSRTAFVADGTPPSTSIVSGPSGSIGQDSASFAFSSSESGSTFACKLDGPDVAVGSYGSCSSPKAYSSLADGSYVVSVRATDPAGNTDTTPATRAFTVDTVSAQTSIDSGPSGPSGSAAPRFAFSSSESGSTFACKLDGPGVTAGSYGSCSSPKTYSSLADGDYVVSVRATDAAGNTDATPATRAFTVDTVSPQTSIDSGPSGPSGSAAPRFDFSSSESGSTFACKLAGPGAAVGSYGSCSSPGTYSGLADGSYVVSVRATDAAGNTDPTPATRAFTVDTVTPTPARPPSPPEDAPLTSALVPTIDHTAPVTTVAGSKSQRLGKRVRVTVSCASEACSATAQGTVRVPKAGTARSKRFRLTKDTAAIAKGGRVTLTPKLSRNARVAIKRALRRGLRITVSLKITATDAAGNTFTSVTRHVKLRV